MLQAERQRLKDLGQELQVGTLFEGGEGQKTGGIYQANGGGGREGRMEGFDRYIKATVYWNL